MKKNFLITLVALAILLSGQTSVPASTCGLAPHVSVYAADDRYYRTELFFGRSRPDGGMVTDEEWEKFLADVVTPRFPDGFTILKGIGQYREKSGKIISEPSEVLVFLYSRNKRTSSRRKIEEIRTAYVKQFKQESVLRVDLPQTVRVFF